MIDIKFDSSPSPTPVSEKHYDIIILGAGPAGLTAGIYAGRALLKTLIVEEKAVGGEAATTDRIENYPGFPDGISGYELTQKMHAQAEKCGAQILITHTKALSIDDATKTVVTEEGTFTARAIIMATGSSPKLLNVPGETKFRGKGVSYCATCDAPFFADRDIAVIGAGNSGIQESIYLLDHVKSIKIIEFLPHMNAEKVLQERIKKQNNVQLFLNTKVLSINGDETVSSITIEQRETHKREELAVSGIFIYVGLDPNTGLLADSVELDPHGFIIANDHLATSAPGVFAAGDVRKKMLRQVATAIGDGALAAHAAQHFIDQL
jgi:thioredoxin reductase (NADPH)